jgi:hypothetical protein
VSEDILRKLIMQVRNWGTWGPDDEIGTLNYIAPDAVAAAARRATRRQGLRALDPAAARGPGCAADGRYTFLLVAPPLPVTHGVGTPINPYAIT